MIDINALVRAWLLTDSLVYADDDGFVQNQVPVLLLDNFTPGAGPPNDTSDRIYVGHLVPGFDIKFGPGIVIRVGSGTQTGTAGGSAHPEMPLAMPRVQITVFAGTQQYQRAREFYRAIFDWMHGRNMVDLGDDGFVLGCQEITEGQDFDDPQSHIATNISYWALNVRR